MQRPQVSWQKAVAIIYLIVRYYAAYMLLSYGFAKVMGAQFTVLDSQLAKPLGDISGFWLTWYYFGYSAVYSSLIAWTQIGGALLLCFRRTALIGAILLLPVMVNIVGIDLWVIHFPFSSGALRNAIYVLVAVLVITAFHAADLYKFFIKRRDHLLLFAKMPHWTPFIPLAAASGMIAYTAHDAYWIANVNNRAPTPIDGAWHVITIQPSLDQTPEWIYFEYNRAYMVVFLFRDGKSETHDFRVDSSTHALNISETWLTAGSELFRGNWDRQGDAIILRGTWKNQTSIYLLLQRKQMQVRDHL